MLKTLRNPFLCFGVSTVRKSFSCSNTEIVTDMTEKRFGPYVNSPPSDRKGCTSRDWTFRSEFNESTLRLPLL